VRDRPDNLARLFAALQHRRPRSRAGALTGLGVIAGLLGLFLGARRLLSGARTIDGAVIHTPTDETGIDRKTGSVRSVQGADIIVPTDSVHGLWNPENLERLARTYWVTLTRFTLGLVRVAYTEEERFVYLLFKPIRLLTFQKPEYEMNAERGIVRWRIEKGLLVATQGRGGDGYLELDVCRFEYPDWGKTRIHVEVEIANFYPAVASYLGRWLYTNTQSRIHVIICHFFLRQLVKRDLDESPVGRFAGPDSAEDTDEPMRAHTADARA
jgi:hypothetical protein